MTTLILLAGITVIWLTIMDLRRRVDKLAQSILTLCEGLQQLVKAFQAVQAILAEGRGRWN